MQHVLEGSRFFASTGMHHQEPETTLTKRESEILQMLSRGYTNNTIAEKLGVSYRTVTNHIYSVYRKLGLSGRLEAALYAIAHELVTLKR